MREQTRIRIANKLDRTRLLGPAGRVRESVLAIRSRRDPGPRRADGLPMPPPRMRILVDGRSADADRFLALGRCMLGSILTAVGESGRRPSELGNVLDFGCGCGRLARHWAAIEGPQIYGCDYNTALVAWCEENLPLMRVYANRLEPPTAYVSESFDLIYALSVLSHLSTPLQDAWIAEFWRLLRPGGLLVISVLGHGVRGRLEGGEAERFDRGELVVQRPRAAGRNACSAFHPREYVTGTMLAGFEGAREFDLGSAELPVLQDAYVAAKPAAAALRAPG